MTSFVEANRLYNEGKYQEAYQVYQELGKVFGESMVRYQLQTITKKLENTKQTYILSDEKSYDLDIATKLLLANTAKETMQSEVYHELLEAWKKKTSQKSQNALVSSVNPIPKDWPKDLLLSPLPEGVNDFLWDHARKQSVRNHNKENYKELLGLSIIIPTFNRSHILEITLSCLMNQQTQYPFEVVVADDGSQEDICQVVRKYEKDLDIKYVRQKDYGYQLCAVRNLGLRTAKYPFVSILDCDMAPNPLWVESYMSLLQENDDVALIGPRKYVDTQQLKPIQVRNNPSIMAQLPEVRTNNSVAGKDDGEISVDWRLEHFKKLKIYAYVIRLLDFLVAEMSLLQKNGWIKSAILMKNLRIGAVKITNLGIVYLSMVAFLERLKVGWLITKNLQAKKMKPIELKVKRLPLRLSNKKFPIFIVSFYQSLNRKFIKSLWLRFIFQHITV